MAGRVKKRPALNSNNVNVCNRDRIKDVNNVSDNILDVLCPICQCILIDPVTLPCGHTFCLLCFNSSMEMAALACPLCRKRVGSWLRRRDRDKGSTLVNTALWEGIKNKFTEEVEARLKGQETYKGEKPHRILSVAGEIRSEYEVEIEKMRRERKIQEEKQSKESEKLIRELQEQEKRRIEEINSKLREDELLARQLAEDSQTLTKIDQKSNHHSQSNRKPSAVNHVVDRTSKQFYDHLADNQRPNGKEIKTNTLDKYVIKKNGHPNGFTKTQSSENLMSSSPSPELMSTAGRCGRFLKNFLTTRLWGSSVTTCPNTSKTEPKVWEPQDWCAGHSRELSVNTGVVQHHHQPMESKQQGAHQGQTGMDDSITEEMVVLDTASEDSLAQELCYFKPLHPEPVNNKYPGKCQRCIPRRPVLKHHQDTSASDIMSVIDMEKVIEGLELVKGGEFWRRTSSSPFVCLVQVPLQLIKARESSKSSDKPMTVVKPNKKTIKRKLSPVKVTDADTTPRKVAKRTLYSEARRNCKRDRLRVIESSSKDTSPRKRFTNLSRSCVKLGANNSNPSDQVLTRSKRSISFGDVPPTTNAKNGLINGKTKPNGLDETVNNSTRMLRSNNNNNGLNTKVNNCDIKLSNGCKKTPSNGGEHDTNKLSQGQEKSCGRGLARNATRNHTNNHIGNIVLTNGDFLFDPMLVEEQKRIEKMIVQEKKDLALARKLQRQFCGSDYISTGYTVRTAAKKQATLRDILPVAKKMRV